MYSCQPAIIIIDRDDYLAPNLSRALSADPTKASKERTRTETANGFGTATLLVYGSSIPRTMSCFRRMMHAATIANVVRTAPMPQLNTSAVVTGSVSLITRRYASR